MHQTSAALTSEAASARLLPAGLQPPTPGPPKRRVWHRAPPAPSSWHGAPHFCLVLPAARAAAAVGVATAQQQQVLAHASPEPWPSGSTLTQPQPSDTNGTVHQHGSAAEQAAPLSPAQVALFRQAKALQLSGRMDSALQLLLTGLAQYPTDLAMRSLAASLLVKSGKLDAAAAMLQQGMRQQPQYVPFITAAAQLEARRGSHAAAVALLQAGLHRHPRNAVLLQALGDMEAAAGHADAARALFTQAISVQPGMPHSYAAWAELEVAQGNVQRARELYQHGAAAAPDNAPLLHAWARLELQLGCLSAAKQLCEQALKADACHMPSYMLLGQLEWSRGNLAGARAVWQEGNSTPAGASAPLLCFWAQREARVHNVRGARGLLQAALEADPTHQRARLLLAVLNDRSGNAQAASAGYQQLLQGDTALGAGQAQAEDRHDGSLRHPPGLQAGAGSSQQSDAGMSGSQSSSGPQGMGDPCPQQGGLPLDPAAVQLGDAAAAGRQGQGLGSLVSPAELLQQVQDDTPVHVLYALCQHLLRQQQRQPMQQQRQPTQVHQELLQVVEQLLHMMEARAPHNGYLCHLRGLQAQREGRTQDAMAWFQQGTRTAVEDGCLLCWEAMAELLAFLGQQDVARRTWRAGAARAACPARWTAALSSSGSSSSSTLAGAPPTSPTASSTHLLQQQQQQPPHVQQPGDNTSSAGTSTAGNGVAAPQADVQQPLPTDNRSGSNSASAGTAATLHRPAFVPVAPSCTSGPASAGSVLQGAAQASSTTGAQVGHADVSTSSAAAMWEAGEHLDAGLLVGVTSRYLRQWALFEKKAGGAAAAAQLFEAATVKDPQDYKTWLAWAVFERRRGQLARAEQLFRQGVRVAPYNAHLWHAYANMLWRQKGDVNSARQALRRATSLCPRSVHLWLEWALLEWRGAGDPHAAAQLLRRGVSVPGGREHGPLQEAWTQLQLELGRLGGAPGQSQANFGRSQGEQASAALQHAGMQA